MIKYMISKINYQYIILISAIMLVMGGLGACKKKTDTTPYITVKLQKIGLGIVIATWDGGSANDSQLTNGVRIRQGTDITFTGLSTDINTPYVQWNGSAIGATFPVVVDDDKTITVEFLSIDISKSTFIDNGDNTITFAKYTGKQNSISIPATYKGKRITNIDNNTGVPVFPNTITSVILPNELVTIGQHAFAFCNNLYSVNFPNSIQNIGRNAFFGCSLLDNINIPNNINSIEDSTFYNCQALTKIILPDNLDSIGNAAFANCQALTNIRFPINLSNIGNAAFSNCVMLTNIDLPFNLTDIGSAAFANCKALDAIKLPISITDIRDSTFFNCTALFDAEMANNVIHIGNATFSNCINLINVKMSSNIVDIGNTAFANCQTLFNITLPATIKTIGDSVFTNCKTLSAIILVATIPPTLGTNVFLGANSSMQIKVPNANVNDYKTAKGWSNYSNQIVGY